MMRFMLALVLCAPLGSLAADPFVQGKAEAGQAKAAVCAACHGPGGNSANPEWPNLAGQGSRYTYEQLKAFKGGQRKNALMLGQVANLSDQDLRDLAAHYALLAPRPGVASKDAVPVAQPLYRAGDAARGLAACAACHGPTGAGNPAAGYPRIGGQHATYTAAQLRAYRAGERNATASGLIMGAIAAQLSDQEIEALASYLNGLQ